jgi:hypothetical protein
VGESDVVFIVQAVEGSKLGLGTGVQMRSHWIFDTGIEYSMQFVYYLFVLFPDLAPSPAVPRGLPTTVFPPQEVILLGVFQPQGEILLSAVSGPGQSQFGPALYHFLGQLYDFPSLRVVFLGLGVVVDRGGVDLLLDDLADEVVTDALLESHPLLAIVFLQYSLVLRQGGLDGSRGDDEEDAGGEGNLRNVDDPVAILEQQTVLEIL